MGVDNAISNARLIREGEGKKHRSESMRSGQNCYFLHATIILIIRRRRANSDRNVIFCRLFCSRSKTKSERTRVLFFFSLTAVATRFHFPEKKIIFSNYKIV